MKNWRAILFFLAGVAFLGWVFSIFWSQTFKPVTIKTPSTPKTTETPKTSTTFKNTPALNFSLKDLDGKTMQLSDYGDRNVLLVFWTSWHTKSADYLNTLANFDFSRYPNTTLIATNSLEDPKRVESFVTRRNFNFTVLLDTEGNVGTLYNLSSLPATYFIKKGTIIDLYNGPLGTEELKEKIEELYK